MHVYACSWMYTTSEGSVITSLCMYARDRVTSFMSRRGRRRRRAHRPHYQPAPPHAALVAAEALVSCARRPRRVRGVAAAGRCDCCAAAPIGCVKRPRRLKRSPVRRALGAVVTHVEGVAALREASSARAWGRDPLRWLRLAAAQLREASAASEPFAGSPRFGSGGNACGGCDCAARGVRSACASWCPLRRLRLAAAASISCGLELPAQLRVLPPTPFQPKTGHGHVRPSPWGWSFTRNQFSRNLKWLNWKFL